MSESSPKSNPSFGLKIEKWGPIVAGVFCALVLLYYQDEIAINFVPGGWSLSNLYSAILDWSAVQTGFLFGVYGFIVGKAEGFLHEARNTAFLTRFISYIRRATYVGFLLTILSIPLVVVNPEFNDGSAWVYPAVTLWFSLFVWAFLAFLRVAFIFGIVVRIRDKEEIGA